jgi:hypothetical protein
VNSLVVYAYGTGNAPLLDASDAISAGSFSLSAHGDAGGVCYEAAYTRGTGTEGGVDYVMLWEGDTRLTRRTSVALCAANAGSYYADPDDAASSTLYVHPYGSTNPTSDGKTYSVTMRGGGLYARQRSGMNIEGIRTRRGWTHYGPLAPGATSIVRKAIVDGGGIHHLVTGGDLVEDVVALDLPSGHPETYPVVFYRPDGSANDAVARRVFVIGTTGVLNVSLFAHTDGATRWRSVTYDQCILTDGGRFDGDTADKTISNCAALRGTSPVALTTRDTLLVERVLIRDGTTAPGQPALMQSDGPGSAAPRAVTIRNSVILITSADAAGAAITFANTAGTLLIENCVIYFADGFNDAIAVNLDGYDASNRLAATVRNCIIVTQQTDTRNVIRGTACDYTGENNIFYCTAGAPAFSDGGTPVSGLAAWQAATGSDADSVTGDPGFSGDVESGDFRLTAAGLADTMGCGPLAHWDYNTRAIVATPPVAWPTPPITLAEAEAYIADPQAWDFYP